MQHHAADQLHVEVAHAQGASRRLAHRGEGFDEQVVQGFEEVLVALLGVAASEVGVVALVLVVLLHRQGAGDGLAEAEVGALDAETVAELLGLGPELLVGELLHLLFERVDLVDAPLVAPDLSLVGVAEDLGENAHPAAMIPGTGLPGVADDELQLTVAAAGQQTELAALVVEVHQVLLAAAFENLDRFI